MSVSHDTLMRSGASHPESSAQLPPESGGGYTGSLEGFHQIRDLVSPNTLSNCFNNDL